MDPMEFVTHDSSGRPHTNSIHPTSEEWRQAQTNAGFMSDWSYQPPINGGYGPDFSSYGFPYTALQGDSYAAPNMTGAAPQTAAHGSQPQTANWSSASNAHPGFPVTPFGLQLGLHISTNSQNAQPQSQAGLRTVHRPDRRHDVFPTPVPSFLRLPRGMDTQSLPPAVNAQPETRVNRPDGREDVFPTHVPSFLRLPRGMETQSLPPAVNAQPETSLHIASQHGAPSQLSPTAASFRPSVIQARQAMQSNQPRGHQSRHSGSRTHNSQTASLAVASQTILLDRGSHSSLYSDRHRFDHIRGRRSTSTRFTIAEPYGAESRSSRGPPPASSHRRQASMSQVSMSQAEEQAAQERSLRNAQLLRGSVSQRSVVSKAALQSLQVVKVEDLPESERACVICYNDYGVASPEGVCEAPLRLPKCKHVFGNHCIRKWFKDSDSCPYCRDKLESEQKIYANSARIFMDMMRLRRWTVGRDVERDLYRRIMEGEDVDSLVESAGRGEGRAILGDEDYDDEEAEEVEEGEDDENDEHTSPRTRRRRSSSSSAELDPTPPATLPRHVPSRAYTTPSSSGQASPTARTAGLVYWESMSPTSPPPTGSASVNDISQVSQVSRLYRPPTISGVQGTTQHPPPVTSPRAPGGHIPNATQAGGQPVTLRVRREQASASSMPNPLRNALTPATLGHPPTFHGLPERQAPR